MKESRLNTVLQPFDEIDVPLDTGGMVTAVCGYVWANSARFVLKDCWAKGKMNGEPTNEEAYFKSNGRAFVLENVWPYIAPEWQAIVKPRTIVENINGQRREYADPMWLPSATDVFGPSKARDWKDEDDSFQLPIFMKERNRRKRCRDEKHCPYWLRSVYARNPESFLFICNGLISNRIPIASFGYAPGFDIGLANDADGHETGKGQAAAYQTVSDALGLCSYRQWSWQRRTR